MMGGDVRCYPYMTKGALLEAPSVVPSRLITAECAWFRTWRQPSRFLSGSVQRAGP